MARKSFAVFDSDSHVVEPPELWTKYLEPEYRTLGKYALWRAEGTHWESMRCGARKGRGVVTCKLTERCSEIR